MTKIEEHLNLLAAHPLSVIVRTKSAANAERVIKNTVEQGFKFVEVTLTVPDALNVIKKARKAFPNAIIGAGTVLTVAEAETAVAAGAQYLVSPIYSKAILDWSLARDILYAPGVMTVNEMYHAYHDGAKLLKVYPAAGIPAAAIQLITNPFPDFKILVTGGVDLKNISDYFQAGALAVGITGQLGGVSDADRDEDIVNLAKQYVSKVAVMQAEGANTNGN